MTNSSVYGVGSNLNGELGFGNITKEFKTWTQIQFPENEKQCILSNACSIELIAAEKDTSFFVFNYFLNENEKHVLIKPICYNKSHLDVNACSGNGMCLNDDYCECFDGYYGANCNITFDCSHLNNCSGNGFCTEYGNCSCSIDATGLDCSIPVRFVLVFILLMLEKSRISFF
jgi:hypothetical protein